MVAAFVLGIGWLGRTAEPADELAAAVAAAEQRGAQNVRVREPVRGEAREGDARDSYARATRLAASLAALEWDEERAAAYERRDRERRDLPAAELDERLAAWAPVFALVADGAQCRELGRSFTCMPFSAWGVGRVEVERRLRQQRWQEAVALTLDWTVFLVDHEKSSDSASPIRAWNDAVVAAMPPDAAAQLATGLLRLEARLPPVDVGVEIAGFVRPILNGAYAATEWTLDDRLHAWTHGFDPEALHLDAFTLLFAELQRWPVDGTAAEWAERWRSLRGRSDIPQSFFASFAVERAHDRLRSRARGLSRMRALRVGLALRRGQQVPELLDPYDDLPLAIEDRGATVVVRPRLPEFEASTWTRH